MINRLVKAMENDIELEEPNEYITAWNMTYERLQNR